MGGKRPGAGTMSYYLLLIDALFSKAEGSVEALIKRFNPCFTMVSLMGMR